MRRIGAWRGNSGTAEATQALDRLEDARRRLEDQKSERLQREVADAIDRAQELAREQDAIRDQVSNLQRGGFNGVQQLERLMERKDALFDEVADLERQIDRASAEAMREDQREASTRLQEAASGIRDDKLKEKIRFSKGVAQERNQEYAEAFEDQIAADIQRLQERLEDAEDAIGTGEQDRMAEALDRTRDLVRGMESMEERLRQGAGGQSPQGQDGRQGQEGDQGQQGEQGQDGGDATSGQQGSRQGDQGQGQEGQRRLQPSDQAGGQQGSGGGQAQGQPTGDPSGGEPNAQGSRPDGGGPAPIGGGPGGDQRAELSPDQVRQFRSEARQRERDARELRNLLQEEGQDTQNLDEVIQSLEALQRTRVYGDPVELARLQDEVIQGLRRFEFSLRRSMDDQDGRVFLSGSDEVPPEFKDLVEEYYRALSRDPGR